MCALTPSVTDLAITHASEMREGNDNEIHGFVSRKNECKCVFIVVGRERWYELISKTELVKVVKFGRRRTLSPATTSATDASLRRKATV